MKWHGSSALALVAVAACGNIYGVGELSGDESPRPSLAGSSGSGGSAAHAGGAGGSGSPLPASDAGADAGGEAGAPNEPELPSPSADAGAGGGPDAPETPPSCAKLSVECGTAMSPSRDCCHASEVPGGSFFRSYDKVAGAGWDSPASPANLSTFRLDTYEVTVGRFRRFVEAYPWTTPEGVGRNGANPADPGWSDAWNGMLPPDADALSKALTSCGGTSDTEPSLSTWTATADANEALPVNCVTWFEAFAFCAWDGGRLPTEAEWNYAATGAGEARVYPWKSSLLADVNSNHAVYGGPAAAPVGSKSAGDGRFGQADLAGNVWEWNVDWFRSAYRVPCDDCAELATEADSTVRVLRGGAYYNEPAYLRTAERGHAPPNRRDPGYGFRCARNEE